MYLSLDWLKDFVAIPKSLSWHELGTMVTLHTAEVDHVSRQAERFTGVKIGRILEVSQHPNADKLRLAKVDISSTEPLHIVCGAPNIEAGQLVPVATVGTSLPNGLTIREAEIRGEKSFGMLCAEDELGLGEDHGGIMILDESKAKVGQDFSDYLGLEDIILDVDNKSLTNRPDLLGHYGFARDIAAFLGTECRSYDVPAILSPEGVAVLDIKVEDKKLCPRYMAVRVSGVSVKESSKMIRERLLSAGVRPINNIVDITNYVMLELGQPMHAFDAAKVNSIQVRTAKAGERLLMLDASTKELDESILLIASQDEPVAVAGIMGGSHSGVSPETTEIVFEAANFDPIVVRKAGQKLSIRTESSMRFEKSIDPELCDQALAKAVAMLLESCPEAQISSAVFDSYDRRPTPAPIALDLEWVDMMIGFSLGDERIVEILRALGFDVAVDSRHLAVTVPSWRATKDISMREDLLEEIARIHGYNNIGPSMPEMMLSSPLIDPERSIIRRLTTLLTKSCSMDEIHSYVFLSEAEIKTFGLPGKHLQLENPISSLQTHLRQSLVPSLVQAIKVNQARFDEIKLFEAGSVFLSHPGEYAKNAEAKDFVPYQESRFGLAVALADAESSFSELKSILSYVASEMGISISFYPLELGPEWADAHLRAELRCDGEDLGIVSVLDQSVSRKAGLKKPLAIAELPVPAWLRALASVPKKRFRPFEKFPPVFRDLAFVLPAKVLYNDVVTEIRQACSFLADVELFDVYEGGRLGNDKKSLAFHLTYQSDRTLTSDEVDQAQSLIVEAMAKRFDAILRDF